MPHQVPSSMVAFTGYEDKVKEEEWYRSEQTTQQTWVQVRARSALPSFHDNALMHACAVMRLCACGRVCVCVCVVVCCCVVWCGVVSSFARKTSHGRCR
jgi:hypothetical protein